MEPIDRAQPAAVSGEVLDKARRLADSDEPADQRRLLALCAQALARVAGGASTRVAILRLLGGGEFVFAHPPELCSGNRFPAGPSLAGRVLSQAAVVENVVAGRSHFSFYERIPQQAGGVQVIQKMIALRIPGPEGPIGAVEISHTGPSPVEAGPDFGLDDADRASAVLASFAPLLERLWARSPWQPR